MAVLLLSAEMSQYNGPHGIKYSHDCNRHVTLGTLGMTLPGGQLPPARARGALVAARADARATRDVAFSARVAIGVVPDDR